MGDGRGVQHEPAALVQDGAEAGAQQERQQLRHWHAWLRLGVEGPAVDREEPAETRQPQQEPPHVQFPDRAMGRGRPQTFRDRPATDLDVLRAKRERHRNRAGQFHIRGDSEAGDPICGHGARCVRGQRSG